MWDSYFDLVVVNPALSGVSEMVLISARLADVANATKVVVQYSYTDTLFTQPSVSALAMPLAMDCGTGSCALPVDRTIGPVYNRLVYLDTYGKVLASSDIQTL